MNDEVSQFFTREKANEGIRVPLFKPNGEPSPHWIQIRGVDSDAYQKAFAAAKRRMMQAASSAKPAEALAALDGESETLDLLVSVVIDWSFGESFPPTPDNIKKLFKEAPQIANAVSDMVMRRSLFFGKRPDSSTSSQEQTLN